MLTGIGPLWPSNPCRAQVKPFNPFDSAPMHDLQRAAQARAVDPKPATPRSDAPNSSTTWT
jgi:hypothetical protein